MNHHVPPGVTIRAPMTDESARILTFDALNLVATLHRAFEGQRRELLTARVQVAKRLEQGERLAFLAETASVREGEWSIAPLPADSTCRRVEITGPVD